MSTRDYRRPREDEQSATFVERWAPSILFTVVMVIIVMTLLVVGGFLWFGAAAGDV